MLLTYAKQGCVLTTDSVHTVNLYILGLMFFSEPAVAFWARELRPLEFLWLPSSELRWRVLSNLSHTSAFFKLLIWAST